MVELVRIGFAGAGPTIAELRLLRELSETTRRWPAADLLAALRGIDEIGLVLPEDASAALVARGLRAEARPAAYAGAFAPKEAALGEIRWLFVPTFDSEVAIIARREARSWAVELRTPRASFGAVRDRMTHPEGPGDLVWREPVVDTWCATTPRDPGLDAALATWREAPMPGPPTEMWADGIAILGTARLDDMALDEHTASPRQTKDTRGYALARAGLAFGEKVREPGALAALAIIRGYLG